MANQATIDLDQYILSPKDTSNDEWSKPEWSLYWRDLWFAVGKFCTGLALIGVVVSMPTLEEKYRFTFVTMGAGLIGANVGGAASATKRGGK